VIIARDFALGSESEQARLSLARRLLIGLDCSDETRTVDALARLRDLLALPDPTDEPPACPYPGLETFTAANRDLLFGRDDDRRALLQRIRANHTRILIVGPPGSGKSSLIHAAVLPELRSDHVVQVVPRGGALGTALRAAVDALEVPELGAALHQYATVVHDASDAEIERARVLLHTVPVPDARRRIIVLDPLEEAFAGDDADARETLFSWLGGLWSLPWCTVILAMRADFYGALMVERCWHELERSQYPVAPLDERGLRAAIAEPAARVGVHIDPVLIERLIREVDRDRSSVPLPLLQVALKELWAQLRWRYLALADYDRVVNHSQRGFAAVLAVHADGVVQTLTAPGDWAVAQRILLDLVHLGEGRPHTRRRRTMEDLQRSGDRPGQLERVVERLVEGRLVTLGDGAEVEADVRDAGDAQTSGQRHVDLAHDALITGWTALARWIAERRDDLRLQRRLEARATSGGVLSASELPEFTRWIERLATPAGQTLGASEQLRALVQRSVTARRVRRIAFGAGLTVATAFAIVFGLQTLQLRDKEHERERITRERDEIFRRKGEADSSLTQRERDLEAARRDLTHEHDTAVERGERAERAQRFAEDNARMYAANQDELMNRLQEDRATYQRERDALTQRRDQDRTEYEREHNSLRTQLERDQATYKEQHDELAKELDRQHHASKQEHEDWTRKQDEQVKELDRQRGACKREHEDWTRQQEQERGSWRQDHDGLVKQLDEGRAMCKREHDELIHQTDQIRSSCRDDHERAEREIRALQDSLSHKR
jgi:RecA/RadA recombinase